MLTPEDIEKRVRAAIQAWRDSVDHDGNVYDCSAHRESLHCCLDEDHNHYEKLIGMLVGHLAKERSDDVVEEIRRIWALLDDDKLDEAKPAIEALEQRLGWQDEEVISLKTRFEFLVEPFV